jgi:hypothetical protein
MTKSAWLSQKIMRPMYVSLNRETDVKEGLERKDRVPATVVSEGRLMAARTVLDWMTRFDSV